MSFNNNLHDKQRIKTSTSCPQIIKKSWPSQRNFQLIWRLQTGLVSCIEYDRNNQTLIYKSELNMRQHDLETHGSITAQPGSDTTCREWRSEKGV